MIDFDALTIDDFVAGILRNDIAIVAKTITLLESQLESHQLKAEQILNCCLPFTGKSIRIGITGVPGVGKSTFIENMGHLVLSKGERLAVLTVDPSSKKNLGSILGDKTRMETLANQNNVFIRPSPSGTTLGGATATTRECILILEAAGYSVIFVETVGVGQSETAIHELTDVFLLLMLAGAGDELQGIKRGIMEMADIIAINKSDGDNTIHANQAKLNYQKALHLFPPSDSGWITPVETISALQNTGLETIWKHITDYIDLTQSNDYFTFNRKHQLKNWFHQSMQLQLLKMLDQNGEIQNKIKRMELEIEQGKLLPNAAAKTLVNLFVNKK